MDNISKKSTALARVQPTTLTHLQTYTDKNLCFNALAKLEQSLTIRQSIETAPLLSQESTKMENIRQIIRIIEFFLKVTGKELETFQIQVLAGDLYEKFQTDTLEDIIMMFKIARQGEFGKVYKFDSFLVMDWATAFLDQKAEEREKIARSQKPEAGSHTQEAGSEEIGGKYFHELPQELQDQFNELEGFAKDFIPRKASELLDKERFVRSLANEGKKKKPIKFKKFL